MSSAGTAAPPPQEPCAPPTEAEADAHRTQKFVNALTGTCEGVKGILRKRTLNDVMGPGRLNWPFSHQRKCAKRALPDEQRRMLICHDPGTGKTFTFLLIVAALHTLKGGVRRKTLVSAPSSCLMQWKNAVLDTLKVREGLILMTNKLADLTADAIDAADIVIVSRDVVGRAFSTCHEWVTRHHQNERGNWMSQWDRTPGTQLHPLLDVAFDLVGVDEVHFLRNPMTGWTKAHELICSKAAKVMGLTATPIFNRPQDLIGISIGVDLLEKFKLASTWFADRTKQKLNLPAIREFQGYVDRVLDSILNLPPITDHVVNFDACIAPEDVDGYNQLLCDSRRLRVAFERRGRATQDELRRLMSHLQRMQQYLISPLLADEGAQALRADPALVERASLQNTGALQALKNTILELNGKGYSRVMVAVCHTSLMQVASAYLKRECPQVGNVILYHGGLTLKKRAEATSAFLGGRQTVLLMSVDAGGTGLHLVPGSNAVVFWGSRPFSPMQVLQTKKRVHRIGQEFPVEVIHLIANGSVDYAINMVHADKLTLSRAVVDNDTATLESQEGRWRTAGRIVDRCQFLAEDGTFPEVPITEEAIQQRYSAQPVPGAPAAAAAGGGTLLQNAMHFMGLFNPAAATTDDADEAAAAATDEADFLTEDAGAAGPSGVHDSGDDADLVLPAL